jgi:sarcosine oxidase
MHCSPGSLFENVPAGYAPRHVKNWDVIVIGGGAVGSAAMRAAAEAGAQALGLERFAPAHERGSSHGHSRIFRHAYFEHPDYVPLLRHSTARFESLERESGAALLHRCGMLVAGPRDSDVVHGSLASGKRWGLGVEALDAALLQARFPWFDFADDAIGAFEADAGIVRPEAAVHAALAVARIRGAELRTGTRVHAVTEDETGVWVETDRGRERATSVVVAAGPWSAQLLPELTTRLTVTRQVQAWVATTPGKDVSTMPCWFVDRGPGERALYGLAPDPAAAAHEDGAASYSRHPKVGLHGSDDVVDPDAGAAAIDDTDLARVWRAYRAVAPALAGPVVAAATCLYTMSPDGQFIVGTRPGSRRIQVAAGLSGHGFKLAPALGDALVDLAIHGRTDLPIGFLSPARYA